MVFTKAPTKAADLPRRNGTAADPQTSRAAKPGTRRHPAKEPRRRPKRPTNRTATEGRTNRPLAAVAVLMIVGCATAGAVAYTSAGDRHDVLALAKTIPAGQTITADDLRVAEVNGSGFSAIVKEHANLVVGSTALSTLPEGTLITTGMYSKDPMPEPGNVIVGASLAPGMVPSDAQPGRRVTVYRITKADGAASSNDAAVIVNSALVMAVTTDVAGGNTLLSLDLPRETATAYTSASASGSVAIAVLPAGS